MLLARIFNNLLNPSPPTGEGVGSRLIVICNHDESRPKEEERGGVFQIYPPAVVRPSHSMHVRVGILSKQFGVAAFGAVFPVAAVVRIAHHEWQHGTSFGEYHLLERGINLAPAAGFFQGAG